MNANINLLLRKDEETLKRQRRIKKLNLLAVSFLIGIGALSFFIFLLIQIINPTSVKKEQDETFRKISVYQTRQAKLLILENRVNNISEIFNKRKDLSKVIQTILTKTPDRIFIESLEVDGKSVIMTAYSSSLSSIGDFINNFTDMVRKKDLIDALTINALVFDEERGSYEISLTANLIL